MSLGLFLLLVFSVIIIIRMRNVFYIEPGNIAPYKTLVRIITYTLRHHHPQRRRSTFFYYSDLRPGRLDFAKVHYGGQFSTEDVENVKTFLQILRLLVSIGFTYILSVPTSYFMYQHYVRHLVNRSLITEHCLAFWPFLGSGNITNVISLLFFPIYRVIIFKVLNRIPKILVRLLTGLTIMIMCIISFLLIEVISHYDFTTNEKNNIDTYECAFICQLITV